MLCSLMQMNQRPLSRRVFRLPRGRIQIQNKIPNTLSKQNIFILAFHQNIYNQVLLFTKPTPWYSLISNEKLLRPRNRFVLRRWNEITRLDLWGSLRQYFLKAMLTSCCSDIRVLSLLFFSGSVPPSFHTATLCLAQQTERLLSTTDSVVCRKFYNF